MADAAERAEDRYPLILTGELSEPPSRALWLVKWLLLIPHFFVLVFLWIAFVAVTVAAFFAILFTGAYPRKLFDFTSGVLRWTWRVGFYGYSALGTDRYPPFTLRPMPYPAELEVAYPEQLSRGLVFVKWWLLAIPHYLVLSALLGSGGHENEAAVGEAAQWAGAPGLLWILVLIAAVYLLFTGRCHRDIFRIVVGINRWVFRVIAYAALMTDRYPPFRFGE